MASLFNELSQLSIDKIQSREEDKDSSLFPRRAAVTRFMYCFASPAVK
jgi:hypothetical protein